MRIPDRMADIRMSEIGLDHAQVHTPFREVITAAVAQHVGMEFQFAEAGRFGQPLDHLLDAPGRKPPAAFRAEHMGIPSGWPFAAQVAQGANLHTAEGVVARERTFQPADVENPVRQVEVLPVSLQGFRNPQAMSEGNEHQGMIADAPAVASGSFQETGNFRSGEVFAMSFGRVKTVVFRVYLVFTILCFDAWLILWALRQ